MRSGSLRSVPSPEAAARLTLETIAAMAMHCRAEMPTEEYSAGFMEEPVADAVVHAYALPAVASKKGKK